MILSPGELELFVEKIAKAVAEKLASQPKLVDRHALAQILSVSVPTIERLQAAGRLPFVRLKRRVLYDVDACIAALSSDREVCDE